MLIRNFRQGRIFFARLDHGADIISQITNLAEENEIETGALSAIGALSRAELGYYDQLSHEYGKISLEEPVELASCCGNISLAGRPALCACSCCSIGQDGKDLGRPSDPRHYLRRGGLFAGAFRPAPEKSP